MCQRETWHPGVASKLTKLLSGSMDLVPSAEISTCSFAGTSKQHSPVALEKPNSAVGLRAGGGFGSPCPATGWVGVPAEQLCPQLPLWLLLCREKVPGPKKELLRGAAEGLKRKETPSGLFSFILQMSQMAGVAETRGGA